MPAEDDLRNLLASRPPDADPSKFDVTRKSGRTLYQAAQAKASQDQAKWDRDNGPQVAGLRTQVTGTLSYQNDPTAQWLHRLAGSPTMGAAGLLSTLGNRFLGGALPPGRGAIRAMLPYLGEAFAGYGLGQYAEHEGTDERDPVSKDIDRAAANASYGLAAGAPLGGLYRANQAPTWLGSSPPDDGTPPPPPPPPPDTLDQVKLKAGARALGAPPDINPSDAKAFIENARAAGLSAADKGALYSALGETPRAGTNIKGLVGKLTPALAGLAGLGAYAALSGKAEALPQMAADVANVASYGVPVLGEARMAGDVLSAAIPGFGERMNVSPAQWMPPLPPPGPAQQPEGPGMSPQDFQAALDDLHSHIQSIKAKQAAKMQAAAPPPPQPMAADQQGQAALSAMMQPNPTQNMMPGTQAMMAMMQPMRNLRNASGLSYRLGMAEAQANVNAQNAGAGQ